MRYFAKIKLVDGDFLVSFPEFPNINTFGGTKEEALEMASEALNACLEVDFDRGFVLPEQKVHHGKSMYPIRVLTHIAVAYELRSLRKNCSQKLVAQALGITYQAYQRLENPRKCNPTIKTLEKIGHKLGKQITVSFS